MKTFVALTTLTFLTLATTVPLSAAGIKNLSLTIGDGDGGQVEAIRLDAHEDEFVYHGGAVIARPRIIAAFVGTTWTTTENAARMASLLDNMRTLDSREFGTMQDYGVENTGISVSSVHIAFDQNDPSSDLGMFKEHGTALHRGAYQHR